jgi:hypothetical protein
MLSLNAPRNWVTNKGPKRREPSRVNMPAQHPASRRPRPAVPQRC